MKRVEPNKFLSDPFNFKLDECGNVLGWSQNIYEDGPHPRMIGVSHYETAFGRITRIRKAAEAAGLDA